MAEQFVIVPAHAIVNAVGGFDDAYGAAVRASELVQKDRVPRVVVQVIAHARESPLPKVDIIEIAQIARTAGVCDG